MFKDQSVKSDANHSNHLTAGENISQFNVYVDVDVMIQSYSFTSFHNNDEKTKKKKHKNKIV